MFLSGRAILVGARDLRCRNTGLCAPLLVAGGLWLINNRLAGMICAIGHGVDRGVSRTGNENAGNGLALCTFSSSDKI